MKKFISIILCLLLLLTSSCDLLYYYKGNRWDLMTVAYNSMLYVWGGMVNINNGPTLTVIEEDGKGRTLFYYCEKNTISTHSLLICQKSTSEHVYFYSDVNFIDSPENDFSEQEIQDLKQLNDWGLDFDESKCTKRAISKSKRNASEDDYTTFSTFVKSLELGDEYYCNGVQCCYLDDYGRKLFFIFVAGNQEFIYYVVITNPDNSFTKESVKLLTNYYNYQEEIRQFKAQNHWNEEL